MTTTNKLGTATRDQHLNKGSEAIPDNAINVVMAEKQNASNARMIGFVSDGQPVNVAAATPKAAHTTQAKESKPPKINGKYASAAQVIESQPILLQWIMFKKMKNILELNGNIRRKLDGLFRTSNSHYFDKQDKDNTGNRRKKETMYAQFTKD